MECNYPPFEMTDLEGAPSGLSVDLAKALGRSLHRPVKIENMAFDGLIPSLLSKKIDLIISSLTVTPERSKAIAFSQPYAQIGLALLTRNDPSLSSAKDMNDSSRTIVVKRGTSGHLAAPRLFPKANLLILDKDAAAYLEVSQGKADAFLYDQLSVARAQARYPKTTRALLDSLQEESWAIGLRSGDSELLSQVNFFLNTFQGAGGFKKLAKEHLGMETELFRKAKIPFILPGVP